MEVVLAKLERAIEESEARVTHDPLPTVRANDSPVVKLFEHVIGNALKFRSPEPPRFHAGAAADGDGWILSIRDNGIGIEPQYAERIFGVFQRLYRKEEYAGTGIGLAICKKIVERYGGRVSGASRRKKGAARSISCYQGCNDHEPT